MKSYAKRLMALSMATFASFSVLTACGARTNSNQTITGDSQANGVTTTLRF